MGAATALSLPSGHLAIGVTSLEPDPTLPDMQPVSKTLPGFDTFEWPGLVAPAGTPRDIVDRIAREVAQIVAEPEIKQRLATLGSHAVGSTPEEFGAFLRADIGKWTKAIREMNISID